MNTTSEWRPGAAGLVPLVLAVAAACGGESSAAGLWNGTIDTLPSGRVVVHNPAEGVWERSSRAWRVEEVARIGSMNAEGPELIGQVTAIEVDPAGRLWVFEGQAQELRVFDADGAWVRTVGRKGGGPGEFKQVMGMGWGPDGNLWVVDPQNNRISVIDTAGTFIASHTTLGGFIMMPWPGGFDRSGHFYNIAPTPGSTDFRVGLVKYDSSLTPLDTIQPPRWQGEEKYFELRSDRGFMRAGVPYSAGLQWRLAPSGDIWFALTGEYRIFRMTQAGDTVREITRAFEPRPVTPEDVDSAVARLGWFTKQGGKVDRSAFPSVKPAVEQFYVDDDGGLWVMPTTASRDAPTVFDVFDRDGRYLGPLTLPFKLSSYPRPLIRNGIIYGTTQDELEVPYVVAARVIKSGER